MMELPDSFDIDTNKFNFGDPRPILHNFLLEEFPTVFASPFWEPVEKFDNKDVFKFKCSEQGHVQIAWPSRRTTNTDMKQLIQYNDGYNPIIILPAIIIGRNRCLAGGTTADRHAVLFLYNHMTKELERIDIKKFSLSGFKMKFMDKKVPVLINRVQPELYYIRDFDIPPQLFERDASLHHLKQKKAHIYPPILLMYLNLRATYYKEPRESIVKRLTQFMEKPNSTQQLTHLWKRYVAYHNRTNMASACNLGVRIRNPANNKCINVDNKKYLLEQPEATCPVNKVANPLTGRCIHPSKVVHVDFIPRIMKTHVGYNEKLVTIGNPSIAIYSAVATLNKFKNAFLTYPRNIHVDDITRDAFQIRWNAPSLKLSIARGLRAQWREQMQNDKYRFIVSFATLSAGKSNGRHANSVIYDKVTNDLEIFDPMGRELTNRFKSRAFYNKLFTSLKSGKSPILPKGAKLVTTEEYYPFDNLYQSREIEEISDYKGGSCALWRLYWVMMRLSNPDIDRKSLINASMRYIRAQESFTVFIRKFNKYALNIMDKKYPNRAAVTFSS